MRFFAVVLTVASTALAITVTQPTKSSGFSSSGSNTVSWTRVDTDPTDFAIVLVNNAHFPNYKQILVANQASPTDSGTVQVNPPSGGWPSGSGFQINIAVNSNLDQLLAQSDQFSFVASSSSSSASLSVTGASSAASSNTLTVPNTLPSSATSSGSDSDALNPSATQSDTNTTPSSNSAASTGAQTALFGLLAFVGALLA